jgi:sigma-B regulation protein RsbU (phosphoserine phosphatase)
MLKTDFEEFCKDKGFEIYGFMNPAREVGGDFYDYFQIDDENIGFVIGDVSGKGVPATLFMIKAMYLIRSHSKFNESPNEVFENVNNLLCERNDGELFVTSWFGKLNLKTGKLTFVNAGHNPPLIKQNMDYENREEETNPDNENGIDEYKDNNASNKSKDFEYLNIRPNLVLGGMEGIQYKEHELNLKTGDILFLYTDGITEANSNYNGFYGEDRLKETINKYGNESLDRIIENIKNDVYEFCRDENQFDDMTMLILKYNGSENNG